MDFKHPQQREMFIEDVRSLLRPNYTTKAGEVITGCPESVLMEELRGRNPPGCRGDHHRYSDLASKRMWRVPPRVSDFGSLLKSCGFRAVRAHATHPGQRRGAECRVYCEGSIA